jgi:tyrosyl-tRNA synthetase
MSTKEKPTQIDPALEKEVQRQLEILRFGTAEITPVEDFIKMLRASIKDNKPLRVKCGIDPTSTEVHLGHTVPYRKMRQFQDLGHIGVVIIGDYTASIGDPTGRNEARPALDPEQIRINASLYMDQVYTVLDRSRTEICYQTEWFSQSTLKDIIGWASQTTVSKLLSHDTFKDRLHSGMSLSLHELFYPVLQGMDSVFVKADVELGGTDQKFNVLMGRDYQKEAGLRPQVAMLVPIITGTCGTQKMSKSLGNIISVRDEPFDKFGKVMSVPDSLMIEYFTYLTSILPSELEVIQKGLESGQLHPNETKKNLASRVVAFFHGEDEAVLAREKFEDIFKRKEVPDDVAQFNLQGESKALLDVMVESGLCESKGESRRLIKQGAVSFMGLDKLSDENFLVTQSHKDLVLKVGKRKFVKII